jgi:UDP-N-acetyl-2-amino-2-deoxyglucuronate dehydrogenase
MTLRFGIIGAGNIAPVHAVAINSIEGAELLAVADSNPERGQVLADKFGGTPYTDYHDLLARSDVDAVTICLPPYLHAPVTLDAAAAGKHVLCEKPMAISLAECDAMIAACEKAGVTLGVVFQGRFEPLALQLKTAIDSGELGQLLWVSANTFWHRTDAYYRSGDWRGILAKEGGGVLMNQAIHAVDLLLWLAGTPARVTAQIRTLNHKIEIEDCAFASMEYENGKLGVIQATTISIPGYPERLEFYGTQGSAIYHKGQGRLEWHFLDVDEDHTDSSEASNGAARPMDILPTAHIVQFKDFVKAIKEKRPPAITGQDGRHSIELIKAIYRSSQKNTPIALPLLSTE